MEKINIILILQSGSESIPNNFRSMSLTRISRRLLEAFIEDYLMNFLINKVFSNINMDSLNTQTNRIFILLKRNKHFIDTSSHPTFFNHLLKSSSYLILITEAQAGHLIQLQKLTQ